MGLFYVLSQLGAGISPWVTKGLLRFHSALPLFVLGAFPVCSLVAAAIFLKETKDKQMDVIVGGTRVLII